MSKLNGKKVSKKNQLHDILEWDVNNMVFADAELGNVPGSDPPISFYRINILTKNQKTDENGNTLQDDSIGDLNLLLDRCFSFGVSESTSPETKKVTGHTLALSLWSREGATEREIQTTNKLESIIQKCKEHLLTIKKDIKKPKLEMVDLKGMDKMLYWKTDEEGERVVGQGPTFSPKLIEFMERVDSSGKVKPYQMSTIFYLEDEVDENGNPVEVDPLDFLSTKTSKKYCYAKPVVKVESIFFGAKSIAIQCKVTESDIASVQQGPQKLLHRRHAVVSNNKVNTVNVKNVNPLIQESTDEEHQSESVENTETTSESTKEEEKPEVKPKKVVKKKKTEELKD